jgi:hypothetical protein
LVAILNRDHQMLEFGEDLTMPLGAREPWEIEFRTEYVHHAADDQRDLGFALAMAASLPRIDPGQVRRQRTALGPLLVAMAAADRIGQAVRSRFRHELAKEKRLAPLSTGLTVLIPERDNPGELAECLAGLEVARRRWREPLQIIVLVNGATAFRYRRLQEMHSILKWLFYPQPLGFARAVRKGLMHAVYDWVFLLNNDAAPDADTLVEAGALASAPDVLGRVANRPEGHYEIPGRD